MIVTWFGVVVVMALSMILVALARVVHELKEFNAKISAPPPEVSVPVSYTPKIKDDDRDMFDEDPTGDYDDFDREVGRQ